jgi:formylglycine-generating enzyme required for sulfatase activity
MAAKRICRACGLISVVEAETCSSCGASFSDLLVRDVPKPPLKPLRSSADDREGESRQIEQLEKDVQPANKEGAREVSPASVKRSMKPGLKQKTETTQDLLQRRVKKTPRRSILIIGVSIAAIFFIAALGLGGKILLDRSGSRISSEDAALTLIATQYKPIATLPAISLTQLPDESLQTGTVEDILPTSTVVRKKTAKPQKTESLSPTAAQENTNADMTQIPVPVIQTSNTLSPNQEVPTQGITPGMTGTVAQDLNSGIKPTPAPMGAVEPQTKVNEVDGATLILIPSGEFLMGSDNRSDPYYAGMEGPPHLVSLKDYWIYRTEVTNAMYKQCVEAKACTPPKGDNLPTSHFPMSMFENHPVVQINWEQVQSYCSWTGGRLPTEAEWEKAARGTDGRRFPWGIDLPGAKYLNYCDSQCTSSNRDQTQDDKYQSTAPVGSFLAGASPYGMLDMAGNVEEWVSDWYAISYKANLSKENPTGPENGIYRVIRGGSWIDKDVARLRVVARIGMPPTTSLDILGFRCVVDKK